MRRLPAVFAAALVLLLAAAAAVLPARAATERDDEGAKLEISPGAVTMSEAEKSFAFDPNRGGEAAVIILDESDRFDQLGGDLGPHRGYIPRHTLRGFHRRAKILAADGRKLANIEIPLEEKAATLVRWWGRTISPDGRVIELPQEALAETAVLDYRKYHVRVLRGALSGVEPGCVIDYGWVVRNPHYPEFSRVFLQEAWPILAARHRWVSDLSAAAGCTLSRTNGLDIRLSKLVFICTAASKNIPPVSEEPWMPPAEEARPSVTFSYIPLFVGNEGVWDALGTVLDRSVHDFTPSDRRARQALEEIQVPPDAAPATKIRFIYDWAAKNFSVVGDPDVPWPSTGGGVQVSFGHFDRAFAERSGSPLQATLLLIVLARAAGFEAHLAFAADRRDHEWNPDLISFAQFDSALATVKLPGADEEVVVVAPASGLPFGEIPWWIAGGRAFVSTAGGHQKINLATSAAEDNVSRTEVTVDLDSTDAGNVRFSRVQSGQSGYPERREMPARSESDRQAELAAMCGANANFELADSSLVTAEEGSGLFAYHCVGHISGASAGESPLSREFAVDGPWNLPLPDVTSSRRVHPLVFPFPRTESITLVVSPGADYAASGTPSPVSLDGPFGRYALTFSSSPTGMVVRRELVLKLARIDPRVYAGLRDFLQAVRLADRTRLRFVKPGAPPS